MSLTKTEVIEIAKQVAQEVQQQQASQLQASIDQAIQSIKQTVQGSTQEKSSSTDVVTQNKQEEILGGEALRAGTVTGTRSWDANVKGLFDKSQDYDRAKKGLELERDQIAVGEERAKAAKVATLQHVESVIGLMNAYAHIQSVADQAKFNAGVSEPIAPNTQDSGNKPD